MAYRPLSPIISCLIIATFSSTSGFAQTAPPAAGPKGVAADRVPFARMLPADALVYAHVDDAARLRGDWWTTSVGRMAEDPQFKPLLDQTFAAVEKAFEPAREKLGLALAEWLTLPKGELGFAVLPVEGAPPAALLMLEAADDDRAIAVLLDRGRAAALEAGMIEETETVGDVGLTIFRRGAGRTEEVLYLRRERRLVIATNRDAIKKVLQLWKSQSSDETLAAGQAFTTLQRLVGRAEGKPAEITWFVDPINLVRATQRSTAAQVGLAVLPALGLDGLTAVGGSTTFNRGPFDVIGQIYVLLDVPRAGVVELIALQPTETEPEPWVFDSVAHYVTLAWDVERSYHQLRTLIDGFQGEGAMRRNFRDAIQKAADVDVETEILSELNGRISFVVCNAEPLTPESRSHLLGVKVKDHGRAANVVRKFTDKFRERLVVKGFAGQTYYQVGAPDDASPAAEPPADDVRRRNAVRRYPVFCLLDDYFLICDRASTLEKALAAAGEPTQRLASSLDYKLIASKARRYAGENGPGLLAFTRPEEDLRFVYGLATDQRLRERLARGGETNPFARDLNQALADRPLPPFEVLQRYYAPAGAIVVDEPTGIRYLSFALKRE